MTVTIYFWSLVVFITLAAVMLIQWRSECLDFRIRAQSLRDVLEKIVMDGGVNLRSVAQVRLARCLLHCIALRSPRLVKAMPDLFQETLQVLRRRQHHIICSYINRRINNQANQDND